ncbi:MAG: hypothetical protein ABEJ74_08550 [Haloferacaceae archaeon]
MPYRLSCDTCDFERQVQDEPETYALAKDHEAAHTTHFVFISTVE